MLTLANVENLHIHDLRRTHASYMAIGGENQYVIAQMLGHKDPRSTAIYARLSVEPVRVATENFATKLQTMSQANIRLERSPGRAANTLSESSVKQTKVRALTEDELPRFITAILSLTHQTSADCFLSLLWTRQRKGLVTGMRWEQLDLENALWHIPQTDSSHASAFALEPEVVTILQRRQASLDRHNFWVFPKRDGSGPVWCLDTAWYAVLHRSGIDHFRLDDLRNTDLHSVRACMMNFPLTTSEGTKTESTSKIPRKVTRTSRRVGIEEQERIETMIVGALKQPLTKSKITWKLNRLKISGIELQRILDEMIQREAIIRFVEAPHMSCWQYAAKP